MNKHLLLDVTPSGKESHAISSILWKHVSLYYSAFAIITERVHLLVL